MYFMLSLYFKGTKHYNYNHIEKGTDWTHQALRSFDSQEKSKTTTW